jgi:hypothetical protein
MNFQFCSICYQLANNHESVAYVESEFRKQYGSNFVTSIFKIDAITVIFCKFAMANSLARHLDRTSFNRHHLHYGLDLGSELRNPLQIQEKLTYLTQMDYLQLRARS